MNRQQRGSAGRRSILCLGQELLDCIDYLASERCATPLRDVLRMLEHA